VRGSKQPPWSTEMSTRTEPGRMRATRSLLTSLGALPDHQHRTDDDVGIEAASSRRAWRTRSSGPSVEVDVDLTKTLEVAVEDLDVGVESAAIVAAADPRPGTITTTFAGATPARR